MQRTVQDYLSTISHRLREEGFEISGLVAYKGLDIELVAKKTKFEASKNNFIARFFLFIYLGSSDIKSIRECSAKLFKYALQKNGVHPLRGFLYALFCFPIVIVDSIDGVTAELIRRNPPPMHWAATEMLVVFSLADKKLYYCEITPAWGRIYYDEMRVLIEALLTPNSVPTPIELETTTMQTSGGILDPYANIAKAIHLAVVLSMLLVLVLLAFIPRHGFVPVFDGNDFELQVAQIILTGSAMICLTVAFYWPRLARWDKVSSRTNTQVFQSHMVYRLSLMAAGGILVFVLRILGSGWYLVFPMALLTIVVLFFTFPTNKRWEEWQNQRAHR